MFRTYQALRNAGNFTTIDRLHFALYFLVPLQSLIACAAFAAELRFSASQQPPYHHSDMSGFEDRLVTEVFARLGHTVKIYDTPARRGIRSLETGLDDGTLPRNRAIQSRVSNIVIVDEPAVVREHVVFTRDRDLQTTDWDELRRRRVGFVQGWQVIEQQLADIEGAVRAWNGEQLFRMLNRGRVDVVIFNRLGGLSLIREQGLRDIRIVEPPLQTSPSFIFLHERHAELAVRAADTLRQMKQDGTYSRLISEYLNAPNGT